MSVVDPIGDLITRIRNAQMVRHEVVESPLSRTREDVVKVLLDEGYIRGYTIVNQDGTAFKKLRIELKYFEGKPVICEIKRVSKPGRRVYHSIGGLPLYRNGLGINILSTNRGVMSDVQARKQSVGGEVLCSVF
jgi:small subunit ribosomal protein S8